MIGSKHCWNVLACVALVVLLLASVASAGTVSVRFYSQGLLFQMDYPVPTGMAPAEAAVRALVAGPTQAQRDLGITSAIPAGVVVSNLAINGDTVEVDLSSGVLAGMTGASLEAINEQFKATMGDFPEIKRIKLTSAGKLLEDYLPAVKPVASLPRFQSQDVATNGVGLAGKKIGVGPSHGKFYNGSGWYWMRALTCNWGEDVLEDVNSIRLCTFLNQYLTQDGATVVLHRTLDQETPGNEPITGLPWWKMCAQMWLRHIGAPSSVWASASGNTGPDDACDRDTDDLYSRPLWNDYNNSDIYLACHTNAGGGTGTETFRYSSMDHAAQATPSLNLANAVQSSIISTIRSTFDEEPNWADRGVKDQNFAEIRIPDRPAILIELAFHDLCTRDALYLKDDFFRSLSQWAVYKGICSYFGNTPTWDKYSCEYVSDTIPTTMVPGQTYDVSVTLRNRGVCWFSTRGFKLVATANNDAWFKSAPTISIPSENIKPGEECTFNFQLTGPIVGGNRTTEWRMVRQGFSTGFGPTITKTVDAGTVVDNDPPIVPENLRMTSSTITSISLAWNASTDAGTEVEGYTLYRDGTAIGTFSGSTLSFVDTGLTMNTSHTYEIDAFDAFNNRSAKSEPLVVSTLNDAEPPTVPQGLQSTASTTTTISLSWNASTDTVTSVAGYTVYRNGTSVGSVTGTTFKDTGLTQNTTYTYTVDAYDVVNNRSAQSEPLSAATSADAEAPTVPQNLRITSVGTASIGIAWDASTDNVQVAGYSIYKNGSLLTTTTSTSYTDSVGSGSRCTYQVDAYDEAGNHSEKSGSVAQTSYVKYGPFNASWAKWIRDTSPTLNGSDLRIPAYNNNNQKCRVVCTFPMNGAPGQSLVNTIRLRLWQDAGTGIYSNSKTNANYKCTVQVHPLQESVTSSVTWATRNGTTPWTTAGGTYGAQVGSSVDWWGNAGNWFEFNWTGPVPTYGMMIRGTQEGSATSLYARKPVGNGSQGGAPTLQIDYIAPSGADNSVVQNWNVIGTWADTDANLNTDFLAQNNSGIVPVGEASLAARTGAIYNSQVFATTSQNNDVFDAIAYGWGNNCSGYGAAYVYYDHADNSNVYVATGSDDRFKLWVNGSQVGSFLVAGGRGCYVDNDFIGPFTLKQGWNRLLMKVQNGVGGYGWCLRLANSDRTALGSCTFALSDATAPTAPTATCAGVTSGVFQTEVTAPSFVLAGATDPQGIGEGVSGVRGYKVYFGNDPAGVPTTFQTGATFAPGTLNDGTYYLRVAAVDYAMNESEVSTAFTFQKESTVATAKALGNGGSATIRPAVVTAVVPGGFYMEDADRSAGIKVLWNQSTVAVGDTVSVVGSVTTDANFERQVAASSVTPADPIDPIAPFVLTNKAIGGANWSYNSATGAGQKGVVDGIGLNNIGMLVRTNGYVAAAGSDYFIVNDGSGARGGSVVNGVKVSCAGLVKPAVGKNVIVTGISTFDNVRDGLYRCVLVVSQDQITISE